MKRLFGLCLVLFVLVFSAPHDVFAAVTTTGVSGKAVTSVAPTPTPAPKKVEYELPYPGILPSHPLYFLKSIRDSIIESLIKDPVSKAEFYNLQADKKVNMGIVLKSQKKNEEAKEAFHEAVEAHNKTISIIRSLEKSGSNVPRHILEKVSFSLLKHKEVLEEAGEKTDAVDTQITAMKEFLPTP